MSGFKNVASMGDLLGATGRWAPVMALPVIMIFNNLLPNAYNPYILFLLYPLLIRTMATQGRFLLSFEILSVASALTLFIAFLSIQLSENVRKAIKEPQEHQRDAARYYSLMTVAFLAIIMALSRVMPLY